MKSHDIAAEMRRAEKKQEAARRRADEVSRRQAEEKSRQGMLAERQRRIDGFAAAALTGMLDASCDTTQKIQWAVEFARDAALRLVEELDRVTT